MLARLSSTVAPGPVRAGLVVYGASRILLLVTAAVLSVINHMSMGALMRSWDARYYMSILRSGYPSTTDFFRARPDAFFPLYPLVGRGVHIVTTLPGLDSAVAVSWIGGAALLVVAARLSEDLWGPARARQAALVLAVFPGSIVAGLPFADPLGLALAGWMLLCLHKKRYLWAGVAGMAATASFSLELAPLLAVCAWVLVFRRELRVVLSAALTAIGAGLYFLYLWVHVGSPLFWFRLEKAQWHAGLTFSIHRGTLWGLLINWTCGPITWACLIIAVAGIVALRRMRAPWILIVYTGVVLVVTVFDGSTRLSPRLVYAMFPGLLALGSRLPKALTVPFVALSMVCLCCCLAMYAPQNHAFFAT